MKTKRQLLLLMAMLISLCSIAAAKTKTITVKNAEEFLKSIGPDRTIIIDSKKPIEITETLNEWAEAGKIEKEPYYYGMDENDNSHTDGYILYNSNTDGLGLQVINCPNLTIKSKKGDATLLATPRYVNVMEFYYCDNLNIEHIIMGHTEGGYCDKGVLEINESNNVHINDCDFFGCGTEGFIFNACQNIYVNRSNVHDCTYHTLHLNDCYNIRFNDCKFYNNKEYEQINIIDCKNVAFTGCTFDHLEGRLFNLNDYQHFIQCVFRNCNIEPITSDFETKEHSIMRHCTTMYGNAPINKNACKKPTIPEGRWSDGKSTFVAKYEDDYSITFINASDNEAFGIVCMSVDDNDYETKKLHGWTNPIGVMGLRTNKVNGKLVIQILDDGGELIKSFFLLDNKK